MPDLPVVRRLIRGIVANVPVRGRHRFVSMVAPLISKGKENVRIGSLSIVIDHAEDFCRNMYYGLYEPHLTNWIRRNIRTGDVVIEPGVNIGFITAHLVESVGPSGRVIGLEPSATCFEQIRSTNDLGAIPQLTLLNAALAERSGTGTFFDTPRVISRGFGCLESVCRPADAIPCDVPLRSVDDLVDEYGLGRVRFLKLDIEGSELSALQGARRSLAERRIDHIMVETTNDPGRPETVSETEKIFELLLAAGFRPHRMTPRGQCRPLGEAVGSRLFREDVMWSRFPDPGRDRM